MCVQFFEGRNQTEQFIFHQRQVNVTGLKQLIIVFGVIRKKRVAHQRKNKDGKVTLGKAVFETRNNFSFSAYENKGNNNCYKHEVDKNLAAWQYGVSFKNKKQFVL